MLILTTYLPLVYHNIPNYIGSHHVWAALWIVSILLLKPEVLYQKPVLFIIIYYGLIILVLFNTLWYRVLDWDKRFFTRELYEFSISFTLIYYFWIQKDYYWLATLAKWTLIFIGITALMSIYSSILNPNYGRELENMEESSERIRKIGGGGYGFVGLLLCIFPIMIYYYKNNSKCVFTRFQILIFIIICFISVVRIQVFANILLSAIVIIISIAGRKRLKQSIIISSIILVIFFSIPQSIYRDFFVDTSQYFNPESDTYYKLNEFASYITNDYYGSNAFADRFERYPMLIEAFSLNPLLGYSVTNKYVDTYGVQHLYWMNRLAVLGLLGFIPFAMFFYYQIKSKLKIYDQQSSFYFILSLLSIIVLGFFKSLAGREMWYGVFFVAPSLYYLPILKTKNQYVDNLDIPGVLG
jgi:hypothetical protein